jgi:putative nucleotidyltransferase with HDIG domain
MLEGFYQSLDIMAIEGKVKQIHYDPPYPVIGESRLDAKETLTMFWDFHVKPVIEITKKLAPKYKADFIACWLAAILHDIARVYDRQSHDTVGAQMAFDFLRQNGISADDAFSVQTVMVTHSCKKAKPFQLEQKILATADALAHFQHPFYLWYHSISPEPFEKLLEGNLRKINHDFHEKIFFEEERESVRAEYEIMKKWCTR